ncbi:MAG: lipase family protein, partial [Vicingaceae bacterium]
HVYNQLDKPTKKAQNKFNKNLGQHMAKQIKNYFPDFKSPTFQESTNYVRVGKTVVLYADEEYYKIFPNTESEIWQHHKFEAYFYLLEKL